MKLNLLLFALMTASAAHAQNYLCPDGTMIQRESQATTITVTIDGKTEICPLTGKAPGPGMCSTSSTPRSCVGTTVGYGDCTTQFNEYGKCRGNFDGKLGNDGNVICGCAVGE